MTLRQHAIASALTGTAVAFALIGFVVLSVEMRGCNPFLDRSDLGVPLCGSSPNPERTP